MAPHARYSIAELAQRAGVSRRTVRFYVQRGLIPPPHGRGRGSHYGDEHLQALLRVRALQHEGRSLDEISLGAGRVAPAETGHRQGRPRGAPRSRRPAPGRSWTRQTVAPGYELHVAQGHDPLDETQLARLARLLGTLADDET